MNVQLTRDELVAGLVRIGELLITGEGQEEVDATSASSSRAVMRFLISTDMTAFLE